MRSRKRLAVAVVAAFVLVVVPLASAVPPLVTLVTPSSGPVGTPVTITGSDFTGATDVAFNGTLAVFTVDTDTQITATVPAGATTGAVSITTPGGTDATQTFTVTVPPPTVNGFSPASGPVGASVTINGSSLDGATAVTFGGVAATAFTVNSSIKITATAPAGGTGVVSVTTPGGNGSSASTFTVIPAPNVTGFSPIVGTIGTSVTINGSDLDGATAVKFNGTAATILTNTSSQITTAVPAGATTGAVSVTTPSGNGSGPSFTVDATPPVLTGPGNSTVEANGPAGTAVTFNVSGSDGGLALLPNQISCSPISGTTFPLGTTTVTCTATDAVGNVGSVGFSVTVADTTAPGINAPDASFTATSAAGIARTDPAIAAYLAGISGTDLVSAVTLTTTTPENLPIGPTTIVVTARDSSGNTSTKNVTLTVLAPGTPAPPPDFTPPGTVQRATAKAGDRRISLTWANPAASDLASIKIVRSVVGEQGATTVFQGKATSFVDRGLRNGVAYRYVFTATDKVQNTSASVVVTATPVALLLASPKPGAKVVGPPLLRWAPVPSARYFNVQLYRNGTKVLSAWPTIARLKLTRAWVYDKKAYSLKPGVYTWYVWPGVGERSAAVYGVLLGKSGFVVMNLRV